MRFIRKYEIYEVPVSQRQASTQLLLLRERDRTAIFSTPLDLPLPLLDDLELELAAHLSPPQISHLSGITTCSKSGISGSKSLEFDE